jgi:hypothetical protein
LIFIPGFFEHAAAKAMADKAALFGKKGGVFRRQAENSSEGRRRFFLKPRSRRQNICKPTPQAWACFHRRRRREHKAAAISISKTSAAAPFIKNGKQTEKFSLLFITKEKIFPFVWPRSSNEGQAAGGWGCIF